MTRRHYIRDIHGKRIAPPVEMVEKLFIGENYTARIVGVKLEITMKQVNNILKVAGIRKGRRPAPKAPNYTVMSCAMERLSQQYLSVRF